jgi:FMN phosphatase YigB (HAD superfamily)
LDYCIFSDEIGYAKPSPKVFEVLFQETGCAPDSIVHVGDNMQADYEGAQKNSMHSILYDPSAKADASVISVRRLSEISVLLK